MWQIKLKQLYLEKIETQFYGECVGNKKNFILLGKMTFTSAKQQQI